MFKPFYVHEHRQPGKLSGRTPRGFTLRVAPDPLDFHNVIVSGAWCSNKDEFNKRIGREQADVGEQKTINKRKLPVLLAEMRNVVFPEEWNPEGHFSYILKFVI